MGLTFPEVNLIFLSWSCKGQEILRESAELCKNVVEINTFLKLKNIGFNFLYSRAPNMLSAFLFASQWGEINKHQNNISIFLFIPEILIELLFRTELYVRPLLQEMKKIDGTLTFMYCKLCTHRLWSNLSTEHLWHLCLEKSHTAYM